MNQQRAIGDVSRPPPELQQRWVEEEEIARTSDDMFLPQWIGDWIRATTRRLRPGSGGR